MEFTSDQLKNNPELREIVKEVVKEQISPELEKMKSGNQHLQEGNIYLNE